MKLVMGNAVGTTIFVLRLHYRSCSVGFNPLGVHVVLPVVEWERHAPKCFAAHQVHPQCGGFSGSIQKRCDRSRLIIVACGFSPHCPAGMPMHIFFPIVRKSARTRRVTDVISVYIYPSQELMSPWRFEHHRRVLLFPGK